MKTTFHMLQLKDIDTIRKYSTNLNAGSILITSDTNQVYILNKANEVIEVVSTEDNNKPHIMHSRRHTNCVNCGAILTSYKCEFCGTEY